MPTKEHPMLRWFQNLSACRKVALILGPGMLTLAIDAFIPHWSWNNNSMKWNQYPPVVYGVLAFLAMMAVGLLRMPSRQRILINQIVGVGGLIVGLAGIYFHGRAIWEEVEGEKMAMSVIGKIMKDAPPLFAPAAFAGIGLLMLTLHRLTKEHETA
jgi:hypothetical protein